MGRVGKVGRVGVCERGGREGVREGRERVGV